MMKVTMIRIKNIPKARNNMNNEIRNTIKTVKETKTKSLMRNSII